LWGKRGLGGGKLLKFQQAVIAGGGGVGSITKGVEESQIKTGLQWTDRIQSSCPPIRGTTNKAGRGGNKEKAKRVGQTNRRLLTQGLENKGIRQR